MKGRKELEYKTTKLNNKYWIFAQITYHITVEIISSWQFLSWNSHKTLKKGWNTRSMASLLPKSQRNFYQLQLQSHRHRTGQHIPWPSLHYTTGHRTRLPAIPPVAQPWQVSLLRNPGHCPSASWGKFRIQPKCSSPLSRFMSLFFTQRVQYPGKAWTGGVPVCWWVRSKRCPATREDHASLDSALGQCFSSCGLDPLLRCEINFIGMCSL